MDQKETEEKRERKPRKERSDKGLVMATRRDLYCIAWMAEQYAARSDQIRRLLSKFPDKEKPFKQDGLIAETTVRDQIDRWKRAGWVEYKRVLADEPGYAWVTRRGLQLVGLDDIYTARMPASTRLGHIYAVNQLRLGLDEKYTWRSERSYRAQQDRNNKGKKSLGPIPDGLITTKIGVVAIEAEISAKKADEMKAKLIRLVRYIVSTPPLGYGPAFPAIWFYVPTEGLKKLVEAAREELTDEEQPRVGVAVMATMLSSKFKQ